MTIINIAGYKFISLESPATLRETFLGRCKTLQLKGTILLSQEGININLSGEFSSIQAFKTHLQENPLFADMAFHETTSPGETHKRLKIKLKKEIITMRTPNINPETERAQAISPEEFKQWLDENRDMVILDTRNDYEIALGTFKNAMNLDLSTFEAFPESIKNLDRDKPFVLCCTGGIRCEKAAIFMTRQGFSNVWQLDGGILGYFAKVGGAHYEGTCFVFDERIALDSNLRAVSSSE